MAYLLDFGGVKAVPSRRDRVLMRFAAARPRKTCDSVPLELLLPHPAPAPPSLALMTRQTEIILVSPVSPRFSFHRVLPGSFSTGFLIKRSPSHCVSSRLSAPEGDPKNSTDSVGVATSAQPDVQIKSNWAPLLHLHGIDIALIYQQIATSAFLSGFTARR